MKPKPMSPKRVSISKIDSAPVIKSSVGFVRKSFNTNSESRSSTTTETPSPEERTFFPFVLEPNAGSWPTGNNFYAYSARARESLAHALDSLQEPSGNGERRDLPIPNWTGQPSLFD